MRQHLDSDMIGKACALQLHDVGRHRRRKEIRSTFLRNGLQNSIYRRLEIRMEKSVSLVQDLDRYSSLQGDNTNERSHRTHGMFQIPRLVAFNDPATIHA